jgi:hypothetical protein
MSHDDDLPTESGILAELTASLGGKKSGKKKKRRQEREALEGNRESVTRGQRDRSSGPDGLELDGDAYLQAKAQELRSAGASLGNRNGSKEGPFLASEADVRANLTGYLVSGQRHGEWAQLGDIPLRVTFSALISHPVMIQAWQERIIRFQFAPIHPTAGVSNVVAMERILDPKLSAPIRRAIAEYARSNEPWTAPSGRGGGGGGGYSPERGIELGGYEDGDGHGYDEDEDEGEAVGEDDAWAGLDELTTAAADPEVWSDDGELGVDFGGGPSTVHRADQWGNPEGERLPVPGVANGHSWGAPSSPPFERAQFPPGEPRRPYDPQSEQARRVHSAYADAIRAPLETQFGVSAAIQENTTRATELQSEGMERLAQLGLQVTDMARKQIDGYMRMTTEVERIALEAQSQRMSMALSFQRELDTMAAEREDRQRSVPLGERLLMAQLDAGQKPDAAMAHQVLFGAPMSLTTQLSSAVVNGLGQVLPGVIGTAVQAGIAHASGPSAPPQLTDRSNVPGDTAQPAPPVAAAPNPAQAALAAANPELVQKIINSAGQVDTARVAMQVQLSTSGEGLRTLLTLAGHTLDTLSLSEIDRETAIGLLAPAETPAATPIPAE